MSEDALQTLNVRTWARKMLPLLANAMMIEGKEGTKYNQVTLGDAASYAIREACEKRGLGLTPAQIGDDKVKPVPTVEVRVARGGGRPTAAKQ